MAGGGDTAKQGSPALLATSGAKLMCFRPGEGRGVTGVRVSINLMSRCRGRRHGRGTRIQIGDAVSVALLPADGARVRECPRLQTDEEFLLAPSLKTPLNLRTVSASSALGRALVGRCLGDTVELTTATGSQTVRIVAVRRST